MANPADTTDYIAGFISNIQTVISNYKDFIGYKILETNDDAFIPNYPAITIEYASSSEEWKSMPKRKTIIANFDITYYYGSLNDKGVRRGLRTGLSKLANCLRENFDMNDYCADLGSDILSVTPYVLASGDDIIAGGVISLQCRKVISVTLT